MDKPELQRKLLEQKTRFSENTVLRQMLETYKHSDMQNFTTFPEYVRLHIQIKQSEEMNDLTTQMRIDQSLLEHFEIDTGDEDYLD